MTIADFITFFFFFFFLLVKGNSLPVRYNQFKVLFNAAGAIWREVTLKQIARF